MKRKPVFAVKVHPFIGLTAPVVLAALLSGCNQRTDKPDDAQVRQQAAQTTQDVKQAGKEAGQQIKAGADKAEQTLTAVAQGVKDGINTPTPADGKGAVDINSATEARLTTLPGVTTGVADKIIQNRPYDRAHDLVRKGVMDEDSYSRIAARVVVR